MLIIIDARAADASDSFDVADPLGCAPCLLHVIRAVERKRPQQSSHIARGVDRLALHRVHLAINAHRRARV